MVASRSKVKANKIVDESYRVDNECKEENRSQLRPRTQQVSHDDIHERVEKKSKITVKSVSVSN